MTQISAHAYVSPYLALTVSDAIINATPDAVATTLAFATANIRITTNASYGHSISFMSYGDELVSPKATIPASRWGYTTETSDLDTFAKFTSPVPTTSTTLISRTSEESYDVHETIPLTFGVQILPNQTSGSYIQTIQVTAVTNANPPESGWVRPDTCTPGEYLQCFTCSDLNKGDIITLTDIRDGNEYSVIRTNTNGKCYTRENLRIIDTTISSEDSDIAAGRTFTIPASEMITLNEYNNTSDSRINKAFINSYGGYYTLYTASAGSFYITNNTTTKGNQSICPKGWKIPSFQNTDDWGAFGDSQYHMFIGPTISELNLSLSGFMIAKNNIVSIYNTAEDSDIYHQGNYITLNNDSSSYNSGYLMYDPTANYFAVVSSSNTRNGGFTIRCVAR